VKTIRRLFSVSIISAAAFISAFLFSLYLMMVILDLKDLSLQTWKVRAGWTELSAATNDILYMRLDSVGHLKDLQKEWLLRSRYLDTSFQELMDHPRLTTLPRDIMDELIHSRHIWEFSRKRLIDAQLILDQITDEQLLLDVILANGKPTLYENISDLRSDPHLSYKDKIIYNRFTANMAVFDMTRDDFSVILERVNQEIPPLLERRIYQLFLFAMALFLMAVLYTLYALSRTVRPLSRLARAMKNIGDMEHPFLMGQDGEADGEDEIVIIRNGVRQMGQKIRLLYEQSLQVEKEKQQAQLKALQYQINPHFLYNTLGSLQLAAAMHQQKEIAGTLRSLSRLLRNTISKTENLITLAEEIEMVEDYLAIMQFRYRNRLAVDLTVPDELLRMAIPGQILQPLLENAIQHGLNEDLNRESGEPRIHIGADQVQEGLILRIRDNGTGMDEQTVRQVFSGGENCRMDGSVHIGLKNIHDRIRIQFGEPFGLDVESRPGSGTAVSILLPLIEETPGE